jgi:hypothetical protein
MFFGPNGSPLSRPEDIIEFLGKKELHWKPDRSAYQTAYSWFLAKGLPDSIKDILKTDSAFEGAVLPRAVFEKKTKIDSFGRESQTDVLAFVKAGAKLAVLGVEAKVDESFGPLVQEWNDYGSNRLRRLVGLLDRLEFGSMPIGRLRYQLFHRTAATLIEASNAGASEAALVVQSFDQNRAGFEDFIAFADAFGTPISAPGKLSQSKRLGDVNIRLGWTENPIYSAGN